MIFIETSLFTKHLAQHLEDEEYQELQNFLIEQPNAGSVIPIYFLTLYAKNETIDLSANEKKILNQLAENL